MKQFYLLSLLLLPTSAVFSQQKFEFGFVVKAGSFTLPEKQQIENTNITKTYPAGASASFGVYTLQRLGGHFGIAAELLYNFSMYEENSRYEYASLESDFYWFNTDNSFEVHTLMIPAKVHFSFRKNGKLSFAAGLVPSFILESRLATQYEDNTGYYFTDSKEDRVVRRDGEEGVQFFFTAGSRYYFSPQTSAGIDFTGSLNRDYTPFYPDMSFCGTGADYIVTYPFWMKSLAISLRHNILR